jgi:hypothetical protein
MPHLESDYQHSVNDCCSCILGNLGGNMLYTVINKVLAAFIGKRESNMLSAQSWKLVSMELQWLFALHYRSSQHDVDSIFYIHRFDCFWKANSSRTLSGSSVNEISCYCPSGCGRNIPYIFHNNGCNMLVYGCLWSSATHITEDARPKILAAPSTLIFKMGLVGALRFLILL